MWTKRIAWYVLVRIGCGRESVGHDPRGWPCCRCAPPYRGGYQRRRLRPRGQIAHRMGTRCLRGGDAARVSEDFEHWDTLLHHSFALATHNAVLINLSQLLIDSRNQPIWGGLKRRSFSPERRQCYCDEHKAIVAAIEDRDPDAAREAMRVHLRHVRTTLLGDHT